jgi:hypothetical protein
MLEVYPKGKKRMDVLWGAWAKQIRLEEKQDSVDIIGIYENIWKPQRSDFPLTIDLQAIVAYQAYPSESNKIFKLTLTIVDIDASPIFSQDEVLTLSEVIDTPYRWFEKYEFRNVVIKEPHYYELSILINQEQKQVIPLWVIAPKQITWNPADDSTTEEWAEQ